MGAANQTMGQADDAMYVMDAAGADTEDAAHEVDDEAQQEADLQKTVMHQNYV